jgi:lipase
MNPIERRVRANGIELAIFEWHTQRRDAAPPILLAHATGFHARCWDQVIHHLGERYIVAVDQRGHGRSDKIFPVHWRDFGLDLAALVERLDLHDIIGVGHSMGGHAMVQAAAYQPSRFRRLVLIDPVIGSPGMYKGGGAFASLPEGTTHPTAKRRNQWNSADEMFERFAERGPFAAWDRQVLRDYCDFGLLPNPEGPGFVLACPPSFESAVYMASTGNGAIYDSVRAVEIPVFVVRAMEPSAARDRMDFRYSPTWPSLVKEFRHGRELHVPERTHFVPMEDPRRVAQFILSDEDNTPNER